MFCVTSGSCSPQDLGIVQQHLSSLSWDLRTDAQPSGHLAERNTVTWTPWPADVPSAWLTLVPGSTR